MWFYVLKRLLLIFPTLLGIITINFFIINLAPGGPIDQIEMQLRSEPTSYMSFTGNKDSSQILDCKLDDATLEKLKQEFGFDKPLLRRYLDLIRNYMFFDFGTSFYKGTLVSSLIIDGLGISFSITLLAMFFILSVSIPLGVLKAVRKGKIFESLTTTILGISYATPGFIFAIWLLIFFAGGSFLSWFPVRGIDSGLPPDTNFLSRIGDYLWHLTLPVLSIVLGHLSRPALATKNAIADEISKLYVIAVRAKGASESYILFRHCLKNALLTISTTIPYMFLSIFFYTTLMIEFVFSIEGIGYIGYEAIITRDYPVMFATIYLFSLSGLLLVLIFDIMYTYLDPRVNFTEQR